MRSLALAAALLVVLGSGSVDAARIGPFPKTTDGIHLEMVFNSHADLNDEAGKVDAVWGSSSPDQPGGVYNSSYMPFFVDYRAGFDVSWYQANHPDWLEYQCDRTTLAYLDANHQPPLDFADPDVRAFQWAAYVDGPIDAHYPSIAVDLVHLGNYNGRCGHYDSHGTWVQQYDGTVHQAQYRSDVLAWVKATERHIHSYSGTATMQLNVSYDETEAAADNQTLMSTTDLLFDERGFTNYGNPPAHPTAQLWQEIVDEIDALQDKNICIMLNGEEPQAHDQITEAERLWAVGNYLLVRNNCTYMYISGQQEYGYLFTYPEYAIPIGHPTADRSFAHGVYQRPYSGGYVLVNPSDGAVKVKLPQGSWTDTDGHALGAKATLQPWTALILLKAG